MDDMSKIFSALGIPPLPNTSADTIATLLWAREVMQTHNKVTYAVNDPDGVEELLSVDIGGVKQWLHIRGRDRDNPVIVYLHGGPGSPMIGWMDATMRPWEDYFTLVHWDQRQTGKSYYPADDDNNPLTFDMFLDDTKQVIQFVRKHLNKEKIILLGHSWGSVLGMYIAKYHPDWLHGYLGIGQVVDSAKAEKMIYSQLIKRAKEKGKYQLATKIEAIMPLLERNDIVGLKSRAENCNLVRIELQRLAGETNMRFLDIEDLFTTTNLNRLISPLLSLNDIKNSVFGGESAFYRPPYKLLEEVGQSNLPNELGSDFKIPIVFFTGEHDWHTPRVLAEEWFGDIRAPYKNIVCFKKSSHYIVNEEPGKVLAALVENVLPLVDEIQ